MPTNRPRRIATEEAFAVQEQMAAMHEVLHRTPGYDPDMVLWRMTLEGGGPREQLLDIDAGRIAEMDRHGVDMHLLSLTSTGVQMLDAARGSDVAAVANDRLAAAIARHPARFAGLGSFAPQDPAAAVREIERARTVLGLNGFIVNSHTNGEYLSDEKFWPILEALEALDAPLYIHPRAPAPAWIAPFVPEALEHAIAGYMMETGLHALKMIAAGVFEQFPRLKIVLGHMGEGLPYYFYRIDHMHRVTVDFMGRRRLSLTPSETFRRNFAITTSGMNAPEPLLYCLSVMPAENILWAIDYPYQDSGEAVAFMDAAPVSDEVRAMIYHRNAERLFGIR